jgi:thiamine pyrophosphokinase
MCLDGTVAGPIIATMRTPLPLCPVAFLVGREKPLSTHRAPSDGKHIVIVANGEFLYSARLLCVVDAAQVVIAADGGANWLMAHGRLPQVLIGDMDSVAPDVLHVLDEGGCRLLRHARDKDETDTELALSEALALGATHITLLGAVGGRIDHALANVLLLAMPQLAAVQVTLFDGRSYLSLAREEIVIGGEEGDVISLLPFSGDVEGITTTGLRYPLRGETLHPGPARGVSNVLLQPEGRITWQRGTLLVVHTPRRYLEDEPI